MNTTLRIELDNDEKLFIPLTDEQIKAADGMKSGIVFAINHEGVRRIVQPYYRRTVNGVKMIFAIQHNEETL